MSTIHKEIHLEDEVCADLTAAGWLYDAGDAGRYDRLQALFVDDAVAWIGERHSEQTPAKYGCKSWPDVLHKSRAFDLVYRPDAAGRKMGWFRERV